MTDLEKLLDAVSGGDETLAEAAAVELASSGESALPGLQKLLASPDADRRWWAVRTLAQMSAPPAQWLIKALEDEAPEVGEAAALALAAHPAVEAVPALIRTLASGNSMIVTLAGNALAAIGKQAVPDLLEAYPSSSRRVRVQLMHCLAEIGDHRSIPLMMKAMDEESALLVYWAKEGLDRLGLNMVYIKPD